MDASLGTAVGDNVVCVVVGVDVSDVVIVVVAVVDGQVLQLPGHCERIAASTVKLNPVLSQYRIKLAQLAGSGTP